ncbi:hypothetical protein [Pedobacter nanyangensis]|uniref:hypothetical protein n=1 Tax=Pedobacter nanyangensis TaxID=1562389 RepID=UPI000DE47F0B|nr:hypothetical protein [Pedobacter nanyangensis]
MKKLLLTAFTAFVVLGVSSCKKSKEKSEEKEVKTTCATIKYSSIKEGNSIYPNSEAKVIFDEKGRIIERKNVDGTTHLRYKYYQDKIEVTSGNIDHPNYDAIYTLDGQGRITKKASGSIYEYKYNSDGYLIEMTDGYGIYTYTWQNGNLIKLVFLVIKGASTGNTSTKNFTYGDDVIKDKLVAYNVYGEIYPYPDGHLSGYFGKTSKNAPIIIGRSYIKDIKGDIIGYKIAERTDNTLTYELTVDYNCK